MLIRSDGIIQSLPGRFELLGNLPRQVFVAEPETEEMTAGIKNAIE